MSGKELQALNKLQSSFFCKLFAVGSGCPAPSYLWDTATLTMNNRIIKKKLLFYHHLKNLSEESLAKEILKTQEKYQLPGLLSECNQYLAEMKIYDNPVLLTSFQWKKKIKIYISNKNRQDLLDQVKTYKKLQYSQLVLEEYGMQNYIKNMNLPDCRLNFARRSGMIRTIAMNFPSDKRYSANLWTCPHPSCSAIDSQAHLRWCSGYTHLRAGLDLDRDLDMVRYFRAVIREREEVENKDDR